MKSNYTYVLSTDSVPVSDRRVKKTHRKKRKMKSAVLYVSKKKFLAGN